MTTSLSKSIIKQALDVSPVATAIIDAGTARRPLMYVNQAFEALSGYDASEVVGRAWADLAAADVPTDNDARSGAAEAPHPADNHTIEIECHPRLGAGGTLVFDLLPLYDSPGEPRYWVASERQSVVADDAEHDHEREALLSIIRDARMHMRRLDGRDSTTGVLNARAFQELLERDWALARRAGTPLALLLFEIDSFGLYCDVFGRHGANACVRKTANVITGSLRRAGDLTARLSDDRFAVLMGHADSDQAADFAGQIAAKVRELALHHPRSAHDRFVTVSCGYAILDPANTAGSDELLRQAEQTLARQPRGDRLIAARA